MNSKNLPIWSAEFLGTFLLTLGGCGSAVLAASFPQLGIGFLGVSLAFGLTVVAGAYAFGSISGAHFNPAVSFGLVIAGRLRWSKLPGYVISQIAGACVAAAVLRYIAMGQPAATIGNFAANGFGSHSPGQYSMEAAILCEVVMTAMFLVVILGATAKRAASEFAGLAIGLCLTLIHLVSIPVTNTSVNPARSIGPALFGPEWAISQLWLFCLAPMVGAALGAIVHRLVFARDPKSLSTLATTA